MWVNYTIHGFTDYNLSEYQTKMLFQFSISFSRQFLAELFDSIAELCALKMRKKAKIIIICVIVVQK